MLLNLASLAHPMRHAQWISQPPASLYVLDGLTCWPNVSLNLKAIFADEELAEGAVVKESLTTAADGKRYKSKLYNVKAGRTRPYQKGQIGERAKRRLAKKG